MAVWQSREARAGVMRSLAIVLSTLPRRAFKGERVSGGNERLGHLLGGRLRLGGGTCPREAQRALHLEPGICDMDLFPPDRKLETPRGSRLITKAWGSPGRWPSQGARARGKTASAGTLPAAGGDVKRNQAAFGKGGIGFVEAKPVL